MLVLVLFNLVDPIGWEIGIIRVEDVALGAAVGVLIGLAAWPRGATGSWRSRSPTRSRRAGARGGDDGGPFASGQPGAAVPPALRARAKTLRADGVLAVSSPSDPRISRTSRSGSRCRCSLTRWYGAEMLARQSVARPPPEAADLVEALVERVHELDAAHAAVAAAIARRATASGSRADQR